MLFHSDSREPLDAGRDSSSPTGGLGGRRRSSRGTSTGSEPRPVEERESRSGFSNQERLVPDVVPRRGSSVGRKSAGSIIWRGRRMLGVFEREVSASVSVIMPSSGER